MARRRRDAGRAPGLVPVVRASPGGDDARPRRPGIARPPSRPTRRSTSRAWRRSGAASSSGSARRCRRACCPSRRRAAPNATRRWLASRRPCCWSRMAGAGVVPHPADARPAIVADGAPRGRRAARGARRGWCASRRPTRPCSRTSTWRCCGRARPSPSCARSTSSRPTCATSSRRAADRRGTVHSLMPPLIFRKGLDLKDAVAGQLAENYHSALVGAIKEAGYRYRGRTPRGAPGARVRVLLRRRSRRRLRLSGAHAVSEPDGVPDRRDHPQPARQRQAARARHPLPQRRGRDASTR